MRSPLQKLVMGATLVCACTVLAPLEASAAGFSVTHAFHPPAGRLWIGASYTRWAADKTYAGIFDRNLRNDIELGDPIDFDPSTGGEFETTSFGLNVRFSPHERVQAGVFMPVWQITTFRDSTFESTSRGTGDIWSFVSWELFRGDRAATAVALQVKTPTTSLPREFETVPLSEGQFDVAIEHSSTWNPVAPLYLTLNTLLRHRFPFKDADRELKPGDEAEIGFGVGVAATDWLWLEARYDVLASAGFQDRSGTGAVSLADRRRIQTTSIGAYTEFGRFIADAVDGLAVDLRVTVPVTGQDYPIGWTYTAGLAWQAQLYGPPDTTESTSTN